MGNTRNEDKRWPGMKKQPKFGNRKPKKRTYGPFSLKAKIKPGLSDYQKQTMNKFMAVREGETIEQWKKRTSRRRVKEIDEIEELAIRHPLRVIQRKRAKQSIETKNKYIKVQPVHREFDFMRYYGIVINFFSIKYGIRKEDLEVGFYFYTNIPFTRDRFNNCMVLMTGTNAGKLNRWLKDGLLEEIIHNKKQFNGPDKPERTFLYKLTNVYVDKLTNIYRVLGKMEGIRMYKQSVLTPLSPEEKKMINDMNDEIMDIQTGRKPQELIIPPKL